MNKIPCKNCLILPLCMNKKVIKCKLLLDYLNQYERSTYPVWTEALGLVTKTLKGSWYTYGINNEIISVEKSKG